MRQPVGYLLRIILIHVLPISELWIAALLVWKKTQEFGLYLSLFFLATFSIYIAMGMLHYFGNIPCSCGGILENMGWKIHLWFNLIFLTCTLITIITRRKEAELQD
jgi:putative oxidoreductase